MNLTYLLIFIENNIVLTSGSSENEFEIDSRTLREDDYGFLIKCCHTANGIVFSYQYGHVSGQGV